MKVSQGQLGRIFMIHLEDGDKTVETIERFAAEKKVLSAQVFMVGQEAVNGILIPDSKGQPRLVLPAGLASGAELRNRGEIIIQEVVGINLQRVVDPDSGMETLTKVPSTKTRVMEKAAPEPEESGPGTIPVYLFNAEFN